MNPVLIIAEAGVNHNGDMQKAEELIRVAAEAGADFVKFQTFKAESLTTSAAAMADYQAKQMGGGGQLEMLKKLELKVEEHHRLIEVCKKNGIKFFSTAFDLESVDFLRSLDLGLWKIPSGEITNLPYLEKIASYHQRTILSTGMSDLKEIHRALDVFESKGLRRRDVTVLHCNSEYPTPYHDVNLRAMAEMSQSLRVSVGYSDHTLGIEVPIAAVALGAQVIEKHFTLSRDLPGPDHKASLEPHELKQMVTAIRHIEKAMGSAEKKPTESEIKNKNLVRKSIVAACDIRKGEIFSETNLTTKRPGTGLSPMQWHSLIGQKAERDFKKDEMIS